MTSTGYHRGQLPLPTALLEALADVDSELEGTYLMWIDLGRYIKPEDMKHVIQDKCGLAVDYGSWF